MTQLEPLYNESFQDLCSTTEGANHQSCQDYLKDERRTMLREMWFTIWTGARDDINNMPKWTNMVVKIESDGLCCGFDPPYSCSFGPNTFGSPKSHELIPRVCGYYSGWYPSTYNCDIEDIKDGKM
eukprot:CAMPEP_0204829214 /NCGR_PEP_ID=MMETSP1346-20131115/7284_1 /ASSEMBLY_ACC=CAM_ASM_000771 /TAXON_ID=215587 /ORGANISM="Aplanochytrium stocchinoi, Strain GSBS06" /LENGTH=125 /DNA_ID=CAMNT_0051958813 /DNA_START=4 /DNA_END=381 /DNA_ORIENTATION=+